MTSVLPSTRTTRSKSWSTASCSRKASTVALTDSLEQALNLAEGVAEIEIIHRDADPEMITFSQHLACDVCGTSYDEPADRNFSFNSPYGACVTCDGLGTTYEVDPELVIPDVDAALSEGAIAPWRSAAHAVLHAHA